MIRRHARLATLGCAAALAAALAAAAPAGARTFLAIATGGTGGVYYPLGGMLAQLLSNNVKDLVVTAQTGNASLANVALIGKGEVETAFVQNDIAYWAYSGAADLEHFKDRPVKGIRHIASLYPEHVQLVATKASGIKSVRDLKGKRVVLGAPGSGNLADAVAVLKAYGMSQNDVKADLFGYAEGAARMKDNQTDAIFVVAGFPTSAVTDLAASVDVALVPIEDEMLRKITGESSFFAAATVPANTYKGQTQDVKTVAVIATWVASDRLPADLVYQMTRALWEKREVLEKVHAKGREIRLETALAGMAIPLHPGAEKYYREVGILKQ
jgi:TRAP transporter TAXI family solute receptor